ncbi:baseplate wedge subunit [Synechococcus phage S-SRM01]|uniref:Baseplate wedge subunit n=1 Tax=Synechococcus phage S-SRM01 TaxID=2781608 RepID=A0A879R363_9CAUD|nr:baseplate wedge subunit [Synechococcus phage S-SRM01]QPX48157.1 baseplate wedge subunit [Synechococcus phage S-SRM01]
MAVTRISRSFKDISLSFDPHPVTKDLPVLINQRAIIRSVRNLVETIPNERFFNPSLGSNVRSSLFDFVDYATASTIQDQIVEVINNYEPRVTNVVVQVDPIPDLNEFEVTITFEIIGQEVPVQQFSFILEATR